MATATSSIEHRIAGRDRDLGGFSVKRVLPSPKRRLVGPFIFFDQMGPAEFAPGTGIDVRPHPHIGLATVTYLFDGALRHRDSLGVDLVIRPGDVNWMTAGHGVVHSERTPSPEREDGHKMFGIQTWVALPESDEATQAAFHHHKEAELPHFERDGAHWDLILGTAWGETAPVITFSPIFYLHGLVSAGAEVRLDIEHEERAIYLVEGDASVDGESLAPGEMFVLAPDAAPILRSSGGCRVMICGGAPVGSRKIYWNFVASDPAELEAAKQDWAAAALAGFPAGGRFTLPEGESEHIPLPQD